MTFDLKKILPIVFVLLALIGVAMVVISIFFRKNTASPQGTASFGNSSDVVGTVSGNLNGNSTQLPVFGSETASTSQNAIFNISGGPVIAATLILSGQPTITAARYVMGDSGHVLELALDVPGAAPHPISNMTIPGVEHALWTEKGNGVLLQYLEGSTVKTVHLGFSSSASSSAPASVHFLPDALSDIAVSPDGSQIAYLMPTAGGLNGYISKPDGSNAKQTFSIPLTQVVLSWPSAQTLLIQSKAASGAPGIALSVNAKTGAVVPLLWGQGLTLTANPTFAYLLYRTDSGAGSSLFRQDMKAGTATAVQTPSLLSTPLPEQCIWNTASTTLAYCAVPIGDPGTAYLDQFHQGLLSDADVLVAFDAESGAAAPIATPGTKQGGEASNMIGMALSPNGHYLSFIAKDDQSLWGVRLK